MQFGQLLDFILFDWDRVPRPGRPAVVGQVLIQQKGFGWLCAYVLLARYKKHRWVVSSKSKDEVYLFALLAKPPRSLWLRKVACNIRLLLSINANFQVDSQRKLKFHSLCFVERTYILLAGVHHDLSHCSKCLICLITLTLFWALHF